MLFEMAMKGLIRLLSFFIDIFDIFSVIQTTSAELEIHRLKRSISHPPPLNKSAEMRKMIEDIVYSAWKICHNKASLNVCPRGRPGPPGRAGPKGDKGRKGRKGSQGSMGPPGIRGQNGIKGDIGPPGIPGFPGTKSEPGESISTPKVTISPPKLIVNESNIASFLCSASGNPAAQMFWSKVNGSFQSSRIKVTSNGLMQISGVRMEDAGAYKCIARNILGKDEKTAILVVQSRSKYSTLCPHDSYASEV